MKLGIVPLTGIPEDIPKGPLLKRRGVGGQIWLPQCSRYKKSSLPVNNCYRGQAQVCGSPVVPHQD